MIPPSPSPSQQATVIPPSPSPSQQATVIPAERALDTTNTAQAAASTPDIKVAGNPDLWVCICKASSKSQGWMKSTKASFMPGGALIQVTTEHRDPTTGVVVAVAEALAWAPFLTRSAFGLAG